MAKVLNTRPAGQNEELSKLLTEAGFEPVEIPLVDIVPLEDGLRKVLRLQPSGYTGIFLSSPNGIRQMHIGLDEDFEAWVQKPFYLVGAKSKPLIESFGGRVAFFPREASVEGFLNEYQFEMTGVSGPPGMVFAQRWLHPCSISTRLDPAAFRRRGVELDNVPVYRPGMPAEVAARLTAECKGKGVSAALFCSASAVEHFFKAVPDMAAELGTAKGMMAISIGPSTTSALRERGVENPHQALEANSAGLVEALRTAFGAIETKILKKNPEGND